MPPVCRSRFSSVNESSFAVLDLSTASGPRSTSALVAAVQMTSGIDPVENVDRASRLVRGAARRGAALVALPELFPCLGPQHVIAEHAEPIPGPTSEAMSALAAECGVFLVAGSLAERVGGSDKCYNTSLLFGPDGSRLARYRKIHLFDVGIPGSVTFRESDVMLPGEEIAVTATAVGRLGQATCYDLRFPELFRRMVVQGAQLFVVPSAFTLATGRDHWEVLIRARAIENQVFVVAPNQYGQHPGNLATYGRSLIVDPWGTVLATAGDGEGWILAEIDLQRQAEIRRHVPCLEHRRANL